MRTLLAEQKRGGFPPACPDRSSLYLLLHVGSRRVGGSQSGGTNICVYLRSTTRSECRLLSTTSLPKLGLRLPSPWMILSMGRSEPRLMLSDTSSVWGILNCRPYDGKKRGPHSLMSSPRKLGWEVTLFSPRIEGLSKDKLCRNGSAKDPGGQSNGSP